MGERVERLLGDAVTADLPDADAVLLNRVVCCYPDYEALLAVSARARAPVPRLHLPAQRSDRVGCRGGREPAAAAPAARLPRLRAPAGGAGRRGRAARAPARPRAARARVADGRLHAPVTGPRCTLLWRGVAGVDRARGGGARRAAPERRDRDRWVLAERRLAGPVPAVVADGRSLPVPARDRRLRPGAERPRDRAIATGARSGRSTSRVRRPGRPTADGSPSSAGAGFGSPIRRRRARTSSASRRSWLAWGAPGIAFFRSGTLWLVDPGRIGSNGRWRRTTRLRGPIAWTPTNEVVATRVERPGDDETMQLVRVGLDGTVTALTPASGRYGRMTVSGATGRIVVSHRPRGVEDWQLDELDPATGARRVFFDSPALDVEPAFAPDGRAPRVRRAAPDRRGDPDDARRRSPARAALAFDAHPFSPPSWAPDGSGILYAAGHECLRWGIYRAARPPASRTAAASPGRRGADTLHGIAVPRLPRRPRGARPPRRRRRPRLDRRRLGRRRARRRRRLGRAARAGRRGHAARRWRAGRDLGPAPGADRVDAGRGNDVVRVRDGWRDVVRCGPGRGDIVVADRLDVVPATASASSACSLAVWPRRA